MYKLKVEIDNRSGFCFGVIYAVEMAEEILQAESQLYCLGDIVHNDMEVKRLEAKGLIIINHQQFRTLRDAKVLIRAHGEPPETYRLAAENNLQLIDASCPVILKLQQRIRHSHEKGEHILIYGKKDHAEVIGLHGQTQNKATVFLDPEELDPTRIPKTVTLYSQTTKNKRKLGQVVQHLQQKGFRVKAHDTICRQVSHRDMEIRDFARSFDAVVFVAGRKSSNGRMLFQVARKVNPRTYFVSETAEVRMDWFQPHERIGICGATSTPQWLMEEIKLRLQQF
ncbi:MAG: 4-hydroxy-3-methylbut-2-enyl diphosphate reductase [Bacteroidota bacterium]